MSFTPKGRMARINYCKVVEKPQKPAKRMRNFTFDDLPEDPREAAVLRVSPFAPNLSFAPHRLELGELVAPPTDPTVAQPNRDNIMERPVYVPPKSWHRGQA